MTSSIRIILQLICISLLALPATLLIYSKLPGNDTYTDNDAMGFFLTYLFLVILASVITINNLIFLSKNNLVKFRLGVLICCSILTLLAFSPKSIYHTLFLGTIKEEYETRNNSSPSIWVNLKLFKNNKFTCSSSNIDLTVENIGTYRITNDTLKLSFENEKSQLINDKYLLVNNNLKCLNCNSVIELTKNKPDNI